ncbi:hypothetical protein IE4803_PB00404 (plasmid) [Rhizobium etli bv. phaseoli str. IE4803]|nr:hypothetical protein IE4803_PB00404 [Rhizobium etli bv. phaseoli str. IE4803]ARQ60841.1 hypothetical protein Kim5_PA00376 [Rhizobium sp. Kim5]
MARICPKFAERDPDLGQTMQTGACSKFDEICTSVKRLRFIPWSSQWARAYFKMDYFNGARSKAPLTTYKAERKFAIGEFHPSITTFG